MSPRATARAVDAVVVAIESSSLALFAHANSFQFATLNVAARRHWKYAVRERRARVGGAGESIDVIGFALSLIHI